MYNDYLYMRPYKPMRKTAIEDYLHAYFLKPKLDRHKSFYNKALVYRDSNGITLRSYNTDVCRITPDGRILLKDLYSDTTKRHIADFLAQHEYMFKDRPEYKDLVYNKAGLMKICSGYNAF